MKVFNDKQLADYVTMRIGGYAANLVEVSSEKQVVDAAIWAKNQKLPIITLGHGSNIIFKDSGFNGLVLINKIKGLRIDHSLGVIKAAAGELWDTIVEQSVNNGFWGIESLTHIPGTVGGAPVNNIGAYGQEIKDTLLKVRAYDTKMNQFVELNNKDCDFDYRNSRFKSYDHGRFIITEITLQLKSSIDDYKPPDYKSLNTKLAEKDIANPIPLDIRQVIIELRQNKLPDPSKLPNTGSFFKNPIVSTAEFNKLLADYPDLPSYNYKPGYKKLAAGWLIEQAGLKNYRQNGLWVYENQALVLINESAKSFKDLMEMINHITKSVKNKFGIQLLIEPEIL